MSLPPKLLLGAIPCWVILRCLATSRQAWFSLHIQVRGEGGEFPNDGVVFLYDIDLLLLRYFQLELPVDDEEQPENSVFELHVVRCNVSSLLAEGQHTTEP